MPFNNFITRLCQKSAILTNLLLVICCFSGYFSMYAFRKTFTSAAFEGYTLWGIDFKIMAIIFQAIGYTISKFAGIKYISELDLKWRGLAVILSIGTAEVALIFFGLVPAPYNAFFMLLNGLPLGTIWGLIFSYLEGRKLTEVLGAGMNISLIVSSGAVKSVGAQIVQKGVCSQFWMPALVGAMFFPVTLITTFILESIPPPTEEDIAARTKRVAMTHADRVRFMKTFWPGLLCMTLFDLVLTAYRDFRDNFAPELWAAFGYTTTPSIFTTSELIVAIIIVVPITGFMFYKSEIYSFVSYHVLIILGFLVLLIAIIVNDSGALDGLPFMIITGVAVYFGYLPFNSLIYDNFIATFKYPANSGFIQYLCDALGYLASVAVLFVKNFVSGEISWLSFFISFSYAASIVSIVMLTLSLIYAIWKYRTWDPIDELRNLEEDREAAEQQNDISQEESSSEKKLKEIENENAEIGELEDV